jgi:hypothetical protein
MIYLIICYTTYSCKIGYSTNPTARLKDVQTGNPYDLKLEYYYRGTKTEEKELHKHFEDLKINREWFKLHTVIIQHFINKTT